MSVFSRVIAEHDWHFMLVALLICLASGLAATNLLNRARMSNGRARLMIFFFASGATGCALWLVHFMALLSYDPGVAVGYDKSMTAAAFLFAVVASATGFALVIYPPYWAPLGGAILGLASAGTHYIGMRALQMPAPSNWSLGFVAVSVALAVVFASGAITLATRRPDERSLFAAGALLTVGILSQHIATMAGFAPEAGMTHVMDGDLLSPTTLAALIAAGSTILGIGSSAVFSSVGLESNRLASALDNLAVGLLIFDADERILVCNKPYREIYNVAPEVVRPGIGTLTSLLKYRTDNGSFREDPKKYLVNLRAALADGSSTHREPTLADGRIVSVSTHPMIGGGWVAVHENISERRNAEEQRTAMASKELRRVRLEESIAAFRARVDAVLRTVADSTSAMKSTGETLLSSSGRTSESTQAALASSHEASAGAATVAAATTELTSSIAEINRQLNKTTDVVRVAVTRADKTNEDISALSEAAQKIGDVVKLIQHIAGQTHMLALNATIEAARAGAAGRGFAVVAGEVKSLSIQTAKATEDIARQIAAVQSSSMNAVDALRSITQQMQQINLFSSETASSMARQDAATLEISRSVTGVAQGATNVTAVLSNVAHDVADTSNAARTVREASEAVEMAAQSLLEEINAFLEKAAA
jgi:methyl-accepting chemotaxis protein